MNELKNVIKILIGSLTLATITLFLMWIYIVKYPPNYFHDTYQSMIQDKYEILVNETEPKIIVIGGSNVAFGLNNKMLSEETGYPVANMGLHAGFGGLFNTEIAKANIDKGDIVLLSYEYSWCTDESYFEKLGVDLIMSGIDSKIEMYKHIPLKSWTEIIGYLPTYYTKKAIEPFAEGVYSRAAFNENAQLIYKREPSMTDYEQNISTLGAVKIDNLKIAEYTVEYLCEFREYCEGKGASIYFVAPPLYYEANKSEDSSYIKLVEQVESEIGIDYISNPLEYMYPHEYINDTIYHCSSEGEIVRTKQLIQDLKEVGVFNKSNNM